MNPFQSIRDYEEYIYTLTQRFPAIQRSTLVLIRRGKRVAILQGELSFTNGYRITILASTHPHHKHIPPDIKHNRVPAPNLSFTEPNLPALIQEIEQIE